MRIVRRSLCFGALAVATATIVACGGGSNVSSINPSAQQAAPAPQSAAHSSSDAKGKHGKKGELKIKIRIPRAKKHHGHQLHPQYISASTQSMAVAIAGQTTQTFNLTPTSPGCSTSGGYVSCTVAGFFPSGQQTLTITLYDQTNGTGKALSTGTASANIVQGGTTYISVTLDGIVATAMVLVDGLSNTSIPQGVATSLPVTVSAYDADNNLIIAPGGYDSTTPVTLTDSDTSGSTTLSTTSISGPGAGARLSYNGGAITSAALTAKVSNVAQANPAVVTIVPTPTPTPSATPTPVPTPTPTATPTATPNPSVSPAALNFSSGATQTFTVQEPNYTGTLAATSSNTSAATVSPSTSNGPTATFTVAPVAGGTSTISVSDTLGHTVTVTVTVNGGVIVIDQTPSANPTSLTFDSATSQTFTVHEKDYYGAFTESDTCSGIASTSPSSASGPTATFTVTPVDGGSCTVTVGDGQGNTTGVGISVTGGTITVNSKHGKSPLHGGK